MLPRIRSRESHIEAFSHSQGQQQALPRRTIGVRYAPNQRT
jgi:hypothetical protein